MVLAFRAFGMVQPPAVNTLGMETMTAVGVSGGLVFVAQKTDIIFSDVLDLLLLLFREAFAGTLELFWSVMV